MIPRAGGRDRPPTRMEAAGMAPDLALAGPMVPGVLEGE